MVILHFDSVDFLSRKSGRFSSSSIRSSGSSSRTSGSSSSNSGSNSRSSGTTWLYSSTWIDIQITWLLLRHMCLSAIVPLFFAGFGNLTVQGRFCRIFLNDSILFHFCREEPVGVELEFSPPCRSTCTASSRHCTDPPRPR